MTAASPTPDAAESRTRDEVVLDITDGSATTAAAPDRFRRLAETAPVGMIEADGEVGITYVNERWRQITGVDTATPLPWAEVSGLVHADDRERVVAGYVAVLAEGREFDQTARIVRADGEVRHVRLQATPLESGCGGTGFVGTVMDLTEQVRATEALRRREAHYRSLMLDAPVPQIITELDGTLVEYNHAFRELMGAEPAEIEGRPPHLLIHPDDLPAVVHEVERLLGGEAGWFELERRLIRPDGTVITVSSGTALRRDGDQVLLHSVMQDVTAKAAALDALTDSETRFRTLAEQLPVGVFHADPSGRVDYANPQWLELTGVGTDDLARSADLEFVHPDDREAVVHELLSAFVEGRPYHVQYRLRTVDGATRWVSGRGAQTVDRESGAPTGIIGSIEDVTPLLEATDRTTRLAGIVESTSDLVGVVDWSSDRIVYLNRAARELFGVADRDLSELTYHDIFADGAGELVRDHVIPALERGEVWSGELPMRAADGSTVYVWQTIAAELTGDGGIGQLSAVGRDVTDRRRLEAELAWQATHDPLTELPNRTLLLDHLDLALARAEREHALVAVLFLDLDRFKQVNDQFGHEAGDELLVQAAQRLRAVLRPTDTVARLGGDEFVVLAEEIDDETHVHDLAQRVSEAIAATPFVVAGHEVDVTASIGIALSGGHVEHPETLLRDADAAMYRAKDLGRARLEIYDESMRARAVRRTQLADQLASGIEDDHITVHYQPCVDLLTGRIRSVEALARWAHPARGLLSPYEFIALAEETGLIVGLGLVVLSKACRQAQDWHERFGHAAPSVHVNLSARQLTAPNLPSLVEGVLDGSGLHPSRLCLEITESVLMDDAPAVIDTLWALKAIGCTLAIDDFGTGYSSLSYLRRFPVDVLKVDQSFVAGLGPDPEDSAIVAAIINLAGSLDLDAVAEGVETREQLERLRALGCGGAQGFYFAEPAAAADIERHFADGFAV